MYQPVVLWTSEFDSLIDLINYFYERGQYENGYAHTNTMENFWEWINRMIGRQPFPLCIFIL